MIRLFRVFVPVGALALLFSEVLLTASCFLAVTFWMLRVDPEVFLLSGGLVRIGVVVASIVFGLFFEDLYSEIYVKSRILLIQQLCFVMGIALLIQGIISYVNDGFRLPLVVMLPASAILIAALFAWRVVYSAVVLRVVGVQRILLVGDSPLLHEMAKHIEMHPEIGIRIAGYVDDAKEALGPLSALQEIASEVKPDRIVVGLAERRSQMPIDALLRLRYSGYAIEEASSAYEQLCGRVMLSELRPAQLVLSRAYRPRPERIAYQSVGNWLLAIFLVVLTVPLLLLAAVLLKIFGEGALLSRKECAGLGGKTFVLYGLRIPGGGLNAAQRFVKGWRLHALPRLWNVLRGELCFVGPQPERPEFVNALSETIPFYRQRCQVKPGLTGWAQIHMPAGQREDTIERLEYDFYYLKNFSRGLDTYILIHTLKDLFISRDAV